jgi:hypothetical protein
MKLTERVTMMHDGVDSYLKIRKLFAASQLRYFVFNDLEGLFSKDSSMLRYR